MSRMPSVAIFDPAASSAAASAAGTAQTLTQLEGIREQAKQASEERKLKREALEAQKKAQEEDQKLQLTLAEIQGEQFAKLNESKERIAQADNVAAGKRQEEAIGAQKEMATQQNQHEKEMFERRAKMEEQENALVRSQAKLLAEGQLEIAQQNKEQLRTIRKEKRAAEITAVTVGRTMDVLRAESVAAEVKMNTQYNQMMSAFLQERDMSKGQVLNAIEKARKVTPSRSSDVLIDSLIANGFLPPPEVILGRKPSGDMSSLTWMEAYGVLQDALSGENSRSVEANVHRLSSVLEKIGPAKAAALMEALEETGAAVGQIKGGGNNGFSRAALALQAAGADQMEDMASYGNAVMAEMGAVLVRLGEVEKFEELVGELEKEYGAKAVEQHFGPLIESSLARLNKAEAERGKREEAERSLETLDDELFGLESDATERGAELQLEAVNLGLISDGESQDPF